MTWLRSGLELEQRPRSRLETTKQPDLVTSAGLEPGPDIERCISSLVWTGCWFQLYGSHSFGYNEGYQFWSYRDMINGHIVQFYKCVGLQHSGLRSDRYSWSVCEIRARLKWNARVIDCDSANIGPIATLNAIGERAPTTEHSTYWSCHDAIRTQRLHWRRSGGVDMLGIWSYNRPNCNGLGFRVVKPSPTFRFRFEL